ncbi:MAG: S41 family peptidase [Bacteroidia bacterium]
MMERIVFVVLLLIGFAACNQSQKEDINHEKIKEDLDEILSDISQNYIYLEEKNVDLTCIRSHYEKQIETIQTEEEAVLFFEYLLDEFYDSHLILNTNRNPSFRLFAPIYTQFKNDEARISHVWQSQLKNAPQGILGAKIQQINGLDFDKAIANFPTHCSDKNDPSIREWIANKVLAGRYNEPRVLTLALEHGGRMELDLDSLTLLKNETFLSCKIKNEIGIIRINNSLGENRMIAEFDKALDTLLDTKGLIIDLRNTVDGGNSYVARGIMGRFIASPQPYQRHWKAERYDEGPDVEQSWVEYVSPRGKTYNQPVYLLVGRWTGSMGEGTAIGFEGMKRGEVVGTEMERLAGEMNGFSFIHQQFGYRLSVAKLFHINGTAREKYVPTHYIEQTTIEQDEVLAKGISLVNLEASALSN